MLHCSNMFEESYTFLRSRFGSSSSTQRMCGDVLMGTICTEHVLRMGCPEDQKTALRYGHPKETLLVICGMLAKQHQNEEDWNDDDECEDLAPEVVMQHLNRVKTKRGSRGLSMDTAKMLSSG